MNIYRIVSPIKWLGQILKTGQLSAEADAVAGLVKSGALVLETLGASVGGQDEQRSVAITGTAQNLQTDGTGGKPDAPEPDEAATRAVALEADLTTTEEQEPEPDAPEPDEAAASTVALEADLTSTQAEPAPAAEETNPATKPKGKAK